jgi:hypothetical protein
MTAMVIRFENGQREIDIELYALADKISDGRRAVALGWPMVVLAQHVLLRGRHQFVENRVALV